jgi:predicted metal-dependent hydrolase
VCRPIVEIFQADDATVYEDYTVLADKFIAEDARRLDKRREELLPSDDDLGSFLRSEVELVEALPLWRSWLIRIARKRVT